MMIDQRTRKRLFETVANRVIASADELTDLDRAIGDGDHGTNMRRGFEAVLAAADELSAKSLGDSLKGVGTTLVMKVGGASGPLYGTLFLSLGKSLADEVSREQVADAFASAIDAVKARGKSDVGQKTMLDVFCPVLGVLRAGGDDLPGRLKVTAKLAAEKTIPMRAIRGRASFLGEPIATAARSYATQVTEKLLASDQFQELWDAANRRAHDQLVALLTDDAWLTMPPYPYEYQGVAAIENFLRVRGARHDGPLRLVATRANGQPAFGCYFPCPGTEIARAYGLLVLTLAGSKIAEITFFADSGVLPHFGLPRSVPKRRE